MLHVISECKDKNIPCAVLSLDADKAFDRLNWDYLWWMLEKFGFDEKFIKMVRIIYDNPLAIIATNGLHSQTFYILRGTRQGCPLSPMLFAPSLEPLAQKIRQEQICSISKRVPKMQYLFMQITFYCILLYYLATGQLVQIISCTNQITYLGIDLQSSLKGIVYI